MIAPTVAKRMFDHIIENGGGTFDGFGGVVEHENGYMVSVPDCEYVVPLKYFNYAHIEAHAQFIEDSGIVGYFGAWVDGDSVYLDSSVHVSHEAVARQLGKTWHQLAIYDCANGCTITL